jgi:hypothetical protein
MSEPNESPNKQSLSQFPSRRAVTLTLGGVLLGIVMPKLISGCWYDKRKVIAKEHLNKAEKDTESIVGKEFTELKDFFSTAKQNIPAFVDEALGYYSKWKIIIDLIPFTSGGNHEKFIRQTFEEIVFNPKQLEKEVKATVKSCLDQIYSIESRMLVDLRADLSDIPKEYFIEKFNEKAFQDKVDKTVALASVSSVSDLNSTIGLSLASFIAGEALALVAIQLGVSSGILTTGAASGWATFGIGAVVGLIVDQMVGWIWNWWADPKGDLKQKLESKLEEIFLLVTNKLRGELKKNAINRDIARRNVVNDFLSSAPGNTK